MSKKNKGKRFMNTTFRACVYDDNLCQLEVTVLKGHFILSVHT